MSYCINPKCSNRDNPNDLDTCHHCGSSLLINDRYRVVKPLRPLLPTYPTDIYEVKDWGGVDEDWGTLKVLKVLKYNNNPDLVRHFQQEARVLMFLRDSGFPRVEPDAYFTFSPKKTTNKLHCLIMEKIEGENLTTWLHENGPISLETALDWLQELTGLLHKLHEQNLIHRDIKPSNIILRPNGSLTLIDFGTVGVDKWGETCIGTTGYAPNEQIIGKAVIQSYFFALGRTFVELLTGLPPMDFESDSKTGRLFWRDKAKSLNFKNTLAQHFAALLDHLMEPAHEKRPRNTQEILKQIDKIIRDSQQSPQIAALKTYLKFTGLVLTLFATTFAIEKLPLNLILTNINSKFYKENTGQIPERIVISKKTQKTPNNSTNSNTNIFQNWGLQAYQKGDKKNAEIFYNIALILNRNNQVAQYSLGLICEDRNDLECANRYYEQVAQKSDNQNAAIAAVSNLSRFDILNGKYDAAIQLLTPNLDVSNYPRINAALYKNLGWAEFAKGEITEAETHLRKAIQLKDEMSQHKEWSAPHCLLAQVLEVQGKKPASLQQWKYCLDYAHPEDEAEEKTWQIIAHQRLKSAGKQP